jgi:hypothetical protein
VSGDGNGLISASAATDSGSDNTAHSAPQNHRFGFIRISQF